MEVGDSGLPGLAVQNLVTKERKTVTGSVTDPEQIVVGLLVRGMVLNIISAMKRNVNVQVSKRVSYCREVELIFYMIFSAFLLSVNLQLCLA